MSAGWVLCELSWPRLIRRAAFWAAVLALAFWGGAAVSWLGR